MQNFCQIRKFFESIPGVSMGRIVKDCQGLSFLDLVDLVDLFIDFNNLGTDGRMDGLTDIGTY